jgi:hypothetical protein
MSFPKSLGVILNNMSLSRSAAALAPSVNLTSSLSG